MRKQQRRIFKDPNQVRTNKCACRRTYKDDKSMIGTDLISSMFP